MVEPAGDLLNYVIDKGGEVWYLMGRDDRNYLDMFVYSGRMDKLFHLKVENIRPSLKGRFYGCELTGFGDELCEADELIKNVMMHGLVLKGGEEVVERVRKQYQMVVVWTVGETYVEGQHEIFSSTPLARPELMKKIRHAIPKSIDGRLVTELKRRLLSENLGSESYIM